MARKKALAELSHADAIRRKLAEIETYLNSDNAKRNAAAYVAGTRLAVTLHAELVLLERPLPAADPAAADQSNEEIVTQLADALSGLPLAQLDEVLERIGAERLPRGPAELRVVTG